MLLSHAAMNSGDTREEELREDVCHMLVRSLSEDNECFARWEEIYARYIPQSNNLLLFIMLDWKHLSSNVGHHIGLHNLSNVSRSIILN